MNVRDETDKSLEMFYLINIQNIERVEREREDERERKDLASILMSRVHLGITCLH